MAGQRGYLQRCSWGSAALMLLLALPVHAQDATPRLAMPGDAIATLSLGTAWLVPATLLKPRSLGGPKRTQINDPAMLTFGFDRVAVGERNVAVGRVSDWLVGGLLAGAAAQAAWSLREAESRGRSAAIAESLLLTGAVVEWLKVGVGRERPYTYATLDGIDRDFAHRSFPSGHTAMAVGAALALTLAWRSSGFLDTNGGKAATAGVWTAALAVPTLRVASHNHFPTDVLTSAALAVGCGLVVEGMRGSR